MQYLVLFLYLAILFFIVGGFLYLRKKNVDVVQVQGDQQNQANEAAQPAARRGLGRMRQRGRGGNDDAPVGNRRAAPAAAEQLEDDPDIRLDPDAVANEEEDVKNMTREERKQYEKEQRKLAKERTREEEEAKKQSQQRKQDAYQDKLRKKQEERDRLRQEKEEEEARIAAEKQKQEEELFEKWKGSFSVTEQGSVQELSADESQSLLQDFIDHIKKKKVVVLDELAHQFGLRTQDVVARITTLEEEGRITGVVDDRGKFIYISAEELQNVANFINKRGRVNIADIVAESNKLIDLSSDS